MTKQPRAGRRAGIKTHRIYTVEEISRALPIAQGTVRRWIKAGLTVHAEKKPALITGGDLLAFLDRQKATKQRCQPHELFCVKCKAPRVPAERMADYVPLTPTSGNLRGLCPDCATMMHKRTSWGRIASLGPFLDVRIVEAPPRIKDAH